VAKRTEYRFNPLDLNKDIAVGITLPFGKNGGLFNLSYTTEEQAISNLKNLLLTRKGERVYQPNFGSDMPSLLFEQMNSSLETQLINSLTFDIGYWLPYIIIESIDVSADFDRNLVKIQLSFSVTEQGANTEITIFVDSAGNTQIE
jgi:phage baseplate assembly protein W